MIEIDFERLRRIGLTQFIASQLYTIDEAAAEGTCLTRIIEVQRSYFLLHAAAVEYPARALPNRLQAMQSEGDCLAVGDWVLVETDAWNTHWISGRLQPMTHIARRANDGRRQ